MDMVNLICSKHDGRTLTDAEIDWVMDSYVAGTIADEQVAAFLMAVFWRGLSVAELSRWTAAIIASGERMDLSGLSRPNSQQALDRWRRRQGVPDLGAARGCLRSRGAAA